MKFQVGDIVERIGTTHHYCCKGHNYRITCISDGGGIRFETDPFYSYNPFSFILVHRLSNKRLVIMSLP